MEDKVIQTMLKEKENRLIMGRVPQKTKQLFIEIAEEDFCGDYGMTLKSILDGYLQFKIFFENHSMKLDKILFLMENGDEKKPEPKVRRTMSGRIVTEGGENNE